MLFISQALLASVLPLLASASPAVIVEPRQQANRITLNPAQKYQTIDGFGCSAAFQRANTLMRLPEPKRTEVLDLLFNTTSGAGLSIVRNGIGSSQDSSRDYMNTILPKAPSSPSGEAVYSWDGKDSGQLWFSQQAVCTCFIIVLLSWLFFFFLCVCVCVSIFQLTIYDRLSVA
jgi:O-glycosyl hydrolase